MLIMIVGATALEFCSGALLTQIAVRLRKTALALICLAFKVRSVACKITQTSRLFWLIRH